MKTQKKFTFCDTEAEAQRLVQQITAHYTPYMRKEHPAHYTPWTSMDGREHKFVVWYNE